VVFTDVRKKGCRRLIVDGRPVDLSEEVDLDAASVTDIDAVVDVRGRPHAREGRQGRHRGGAARGRRPDAGGGPGRREPRRGGAALPGPVQRDTPLRLRRDRPDYFVFNNPESVCRTCGGLWTS
jgi:excinuclease ABC subunit A